MAISKTLEFKRLSRGEARRQASNLERYIFAVWAAIYSNLVALKKVALRCIEFR